MYSRCLLSWRTVKSVVWWALAAGLIAPSMQSQSASTRSEANPEPSAAWEKIAAGWEHPGRSFKSHTRWWWPGNALTKQDITFQLEQMAAQGFGGVEIMSAWKMYEKGNHDYLSPEFLGLVRHAVSEGKRLDLDVALTFSPGWSFGGSWVPPDDQSQVLCIGETDVAAGADFRDVLPHPTFAPSRHAKGVTTDRGRLVAVVATRVVEAAGRLAEPARSAEPAKAAKRKKADPSHPTTLRLDPVSTVVLTDRVAAGTGRLDWRAPAEGRWRLMAFWLVRTGQECQAQNAVPPAMVPVPGDTAVTLTGLSMQVVPL